jgi:parallel beta-helix repeat protein
MGMAAASGMSGSRARMRGLAHEREAKIVKTARARRKRLFGDLLAVALLIVCSLLAGRHARAAESYDNCAGTVSSLPATVSTQGVWCLKGDLSTAITDGNAITIAANNVTIDCNNFKIGGLAAGDASTAFGISASGRQNVTIRHCGIRGFQYGILHSGGNGHLAEDNRLDNNLLAGIYFYNSDNSMIRRNRIYDTGGYPVNASFYGIYAYGNDAIEITDNVVSGVVGTPNYYNDVAGIFLGNYVANVSRVTAHITGNRISGLAPTGSGKTGNGFENANYGSTYGMVLFAGNDLVMTTPVTGSYGIRCHNSYVSIRDNTVRGFPTGFDAICLDDGGNVSH